MEVANKNLSEEGYLGKFLLSLYHKRFFGNNGKIEKGAIRKEFRSFVKANPFPDIEPHKTLYDFLRKLEKNFNTSCRLQIGTYVCKSWSKGLREAAKFIIFGPKAEEGYLGKFLLSLYHKRFFGNNGKIEKGAIRKEFRSFVKANPFPDIEPHKLGAILLKHAFIYKIKESAQMNIFKIHMYNFRQYSKELLKRLDEAQKREPFKRLTIEDPSGRLKEVAILEVDPNFEEEVLTFQSNYIDYAEKHFILTSKGCCICQKNFKLEVDYMEHLEYHTQEGNFESLRSRSRNCTPFLRISYQSCKDSPLLRFCIESLDGNLEIQKVVIVRDTSMLYPQESDTPYTLCRRDRSYFFIDCHTFEIGYEQPIVIVFKDDLSRDASEMHVEQHHFLRMEPFKVEMAGVLNFYIPKRGELKCKGSLKGYLPPSDLRESEMATIYKNCPKFLAYERNKKVMDQNNIADIYTLLLQLEDNATLNLYNKLTQKKTVVSGCGNDFSVWLKLEYDFNMEDVLKEGDKVEIFSNHSENIIHSARRDKNSSKHKIYGFVEAVFKKRVIFSLKNCKLIKPEKQYDVKFRPFRYHLILQYRALELLKCHPDVKQILFPAEREYTNRKLSISISPFNKSLAKNPEQLEAVERIVYHMMPGAPYIIFGPPGTGKTTTVVEAIYQLWKDNPTNRILVVGGSNACVDEIAIRLLGVFKETNPLGKNMLRIYSSAQGKKLEQIDKDIVRISNLCHGYQFYPSLDIVYMYPIVFATLSIAAKYVHGGLAADHFSHVFVDECGASTEPEVIATLIGTVTSRTKVILAGDPKQLGPVLQSKTAEELGLGVSLLERLMNLECYKTEHGLKTYDRSIQMRLTKNYRTHPSILNMSNELYYENNLEACGETNVTNWASNWYKLPSPNFPVIFHSVKGKSERRNGSRSLYNWAEMLVVMNYIKEMMYFGINERQMEQCDIGVVTPYKSQVNLIRKELDARKWLEIEVGSVEKFQGQERPVILLSTVRSQTQSLGFLVSPKRLNVSLTRAQALLIVVGDAETLSVSPDFNYVINYCKENGAIKGDSFADVTSVRITDYLREDFNNLSITEPTSSLHVNKHAQKMKNDETIKNKFFKNNFEHKTQDKKLSPAWQTSLTNTTKVDDTKIRSVSQTTGACSSAFRSPSDCSSYAVHSALPSMRRDVLETPKNGQTTATSSNYPSVIHSSSNALSSGETARVTGVFKQFAQPKPIAVNMYPEQSTGTTSPMLHGNFRTSDFWRSEENSFGHNPSYTRYYNTSKTTPELKKKKDACVIL